MVFGMVEHPIGNNAWNGIQSRNYQEKGGFGTRNRNFGKTKGFNNGKVA